MGWKKWRGPEVKIKMQEGSRQAVRNTGAVVYNASQAEVPLRDGFLLRSGKVFMAPGGRPEGCISYGGGEGTGMPRIPYARRWHENSANFQRGRKNRYLADPFNRLARSTLMKELEREGRGRLR
jgi:hypothetical protein